VKLNETTAGLNKLIKDRRYLLDRIERMQKGAGTANDDDEVVSPPEGADRPIQGNSGDSGGC